MKMLRDPLVKHCHLTDASIGEADLFKSYFLGFGEGRI